MIIVGNWDGFADRESGILAYAIMIGEAYCEDKIHPHYDPHSHLFDMSQWTHSAMISPIPVENEQLEGKSKKEEK